jgi:glycosyltransferase involved in cell wall biosynthesis
MRVAVVLPELDPESGGGFTFQETLHDALRASDARGHELVFYARAERPGIVPMPVGRGPLVAGRLRRLARDVQDRHVGTRMVDRRGWFERSLAEHAIDLVWFGTPYAEDTELPFIFTVWDLQYLEQPWFPELRERGEWELRHEHYSRYVPKATRVIVPNEAGREQLLRWFPLPPERVLCLPHPTPAFALRAAPGGAPPPAEQPYLFYPAQFWPHKNHAVLIEALTSLDERYRLVCAGSDKGQLDHVRALARRAGVERRVEMLGFVEEDRLAGLYRGAHALVYPSFFGPENLPPLEAFALGCPVVCSDIPGAAEQLGDAATLVDPTDARAWAAAVERLEDTDLREQLADRGRRRAAELSADRYVGGVLDFQDEFEAIRRCWP